LICARVAAGEIDEAAADIEQAGTAVGSGPWRLFALELVATGRFEHARAALLDALRRFPTDPELAALDAALSLLDGDLVAARRAAEHAVVQAPNAPLGWLARAACALWAGDASRAEHDLGVAERVGGPSRPLAALQACLSVAPPD
jgi:predicted Zn-dependent protease